MAEWVTTPISQLVPRLRQKLNPSTRVEATSSNQSNRAGDLTPEQLKVKEVFESHTSKLRCRLTKRSEAIEFFESLKTAWRDLREELKRADDLTSAQPSPKQMEVIELLESLKKIRSYARSAIQEWDGMQIQTEVERRCLVDLRQMSFEAEDILDDYEYKLHDQLQLEADRDRDTLNDYEHELNLQLQLEALREIDTMDDYGHEIYSYGEVCASTTTHLTSKAFLKQIKNRVMKIKEQFDDICKRNKQLHLKASENTRPSDATRPPTGSIPTARDICGRDADKDLVVKMIVEESEDPVSVIALVGAGGVGKTTLAQMVYKQVKGGFDAKAWICVSDDFDPMKITRGVIESETGLNCELKEFSVLQEKLSAILQGKSLLLVLDDVWNEDHVLWEKLCFIQQIGLLQGSKILVTTRSENVAVIMQPRKEYHYHLKPLTSEQSWQLFQKVVFVQQEPADKQMELIAEKIAYKCRGSPLVITAIGKLLLHENIIDRWEKIMNSELWDISDGRGVNPVMQTLELSYLYLPAHLKQCFLYCSVYPKDHEFDKNELVWLWMAQNLVRGKEEERPEDKGLECLNGLLQRSLILRQESKVFGKQVETFVLHDLMHDLAQYILKRERNLLSNCDTSISVRSHGRYEPRVGGTWIVNHQKGEHDISSLPVERIRVLDLSTEYKINRYLALIGNMKRLRYLRIRVEIKQLPADSLRKLYYLNTVVVQGIHRVRLPEGICMLQNLRHLSLSGLSWSIYFPVGFGRLANLQHLPIFDVRRVGTHCTIAELKGLRSLRGHLHIRGLENVKTGEEAKAAELDKLVGVLSLDLNTCNNLEVLENLRPHANLAELEINCYYDTAFPRWLGDPSFTKLVKVTLSNGDCEELPGLGQLPCLKILSVSYLKRVQHVGVEFFGCCPSSEAFPMLERLSFMHLSNWEEWSVPEECKFTRLKCLNFHVCQRLKLPLVIKKPPPTLSELNVGGSSKIETWCREHATMLLAGIRLEYW